jgi:phasin family protein
MATQNFFANNPFTQGAFADAMKQFSDMKTAQFDVSRVMDFNRRNVEAFSSANQTVSEGVQTIARRQAEIARNHVETMIQTSREMLTSASPEVNTSRQAALAREVFEASLSNLRELSELATKSSFEVMDVLNRRAAEGMEELSAFSKKAA